MKVKQYKTVFGEDNLPTLVKEKEIQYEGEKFDRPEAVNKMMREVFGIHRQTEEYLYEICLNVKNGLLGVFEISQGSVAYTASSPREIFQKAILCGAAAVILVHNHPSGDVEPSMDDVKSFENMKTLGKMMNVQILDSIIIGERDFYSLEKFCK